MHLWGLAVRTLGGASCSLGKVSFASLGLLGFVSFPLGLLGFLFDFCLPVGLLKLHRGVSFTSG